jgi:hypothetical protein
MKQIRQIVSRPRAALRLREGWSSAVAEVPLRNILINCERWVAAVIGGARLEGGWAFDGAELRLVGWSGSDGESTLGESVLKRSATEPYFGLMGFFGGMVSELD